ncbi:MAG TPA: class I SAM-dependent methyltransferase [Ktedonobacterales bacterium]|jgi:SAM-dependent methyltransferase
MDSSQFDIRHHPTVSVEEGYGEWSKTYDEVEVGTLDRQLLARIKTVPWAEVREAADLACGTGRIGAWLKQQGVETLDGIDLTPEMLEQARARGIYRQLELGDVRKTPFVAAQYDLVTEVLADEHLPEVAPLYQEAARLARAGGYFVLVGFHPYFLMRGIPTSFVNAGGETRTISSYVHLLSEHVQAALAARWALREMYEWVVDEEWISKKARRQQYRNWPISFALVWQKEK